MTRRIALSLAGAIAAVGFATADSAPAAEPQTADMQVISSIATSRFVLLGVGKSVVIDLPVDVKDVLIGNPKVALATLRTKRRAYVTGGDVGQTNVYFFDEEGRQIGGLDIEVASNPELKPPMLANSGIPAMAVDVYRGDKERLTVICSTVRCTVPPKEPPPSNTTIINTNSSQTGPTGTTASTSTSTSSSSR
jgi:Flp pilus assembly secretin CpaC